jgi:hypothetical protein
MKTKKVNRYYCDFCNRGGCSAAHMKKHERHCTANPERECRVCGNAVRPRDVRVPLGPNDPQRGEAERVLDFYRTAYSWPDTIDEREAEAEREFEKLMGADVASRALEEIRSASRNCPACILAVIRQSESLLTFDFDFKKEMAEWWQAKNDEAEEARLNRGY